MTPYKRTLEDMIGGKPKIKPELEGLCKIYAEVIDALEIPQIRIRDCSEVLRLPLEGLFSEKNQKQIKEKDYPVIRISGVNYTASELTDLFKIMCDYDHNTKRLIRNAVLYSLAQRLDESDKSQFNLKASLYQYLEKAEFIDIEFDKENNIKKLMHEKGVPLENRELFERIFYALDEEDDKKLYNNITSWRKDVNGKLRINPSRGRLTELTDAKDIYEIDYLIKKYDIINEYEKMCFEQKAREKKNGENI